MFFILIFFFFFQAEDGIRDVAVTGVQTCALPIFKNTEEANDKLPLGNGVWDTREPGAYSCAHNGQYKMNTTHKAWVKGNFFD